MSVTTATATPGVARSLRGLVVWLGLAAVLVGLSIAVLWPNEADITSDPQNGGATGARAVAQVLRQQGVTVTVVHTRAGLAAATAKVVGDATVVMTGSEFADYEAGQALHDVHQRYRHVVLIGLSADALEGTRFGVYPSSPVTQKQALVAACQTKLIGQTLRISNVSRFLVPGINGNAQGCFPGNQGYGLIVLPRAESPEEIALLAGGGIIQNGSITENDNATLALRLLGRDPSLVWYSPGGSEADPSSPTPSEGPGLVPGWVSQVALMLGVVVVGAMFWRGRRLGRLVIEPLPVVIKAIETTQSRARMYHRTADRARTLAIMRMATRRRVLDRLALPSGTDQFELTAALVRATGRPPAQIDWLLFAALTPDDPTLVTLANELVALEQEVRRP